MVLAPITLDEDYWETFELNDEDIEVLYNHVLEMETPLSPEELISILVTNRLERERLAAEQEMSAGAKAYLPEESFKVGRSQKKLFHMAKLFL